MKNLILIIILLLTTILNASITVYEPFDYAPTNGINGLNGGAGWAYAWYTSNNDSNSVITVPGLVYKFNFFFVFFRVFVADIFCSH